MKHILTAVTVLFFSLSAQAIKDKKLETEFISPLTQSITDVRLPNKCATVDSAIKAPECYSAVVSRMASLRLGFDLCVNDMASDEACQIIGSEISDVTPIFEAIQDEMNMLIRKQENIRRTHK
ncbi:MAG: hypothetical protein HRU20_19690 [Pseudomonadales bacterium]|nr:hypothetical protein [Pseudomonadales bacterium]